MFKRRELVFFVSLFFLAANFTVKANESGYTDPETGDADALYEESGGVEEGLHDEAAVSSGETDFTQTATAETGDSLEDLQDGPLQDSTPSGLKNNKYYLDSLRYASLARLAFSLGEYEESAWNSSEAERLAKLSDEYISNKIKSRLAALRFAEAQKRFEWAKTSGAAEYYKKEVEQAQTDYAEAVGARNGGDLDAVIVWSEKVIEDLIDVAAPPPKEKMAEVVKSQPRLPTQYKVRPWDEFGDCLWNISARFYGTPWRWTVLYMANKHNLPDENNPDLIETGSLIDIPDVNGDEYRSGLYDTGVLYKPEKTNNLYE
ncbi:MAG: hypothetical protein LBC53_07345 [Spirochaetaceae bacterium]|jgi:nucleoid-associated protein YgaU|nr:hypothetical protein [Spirochaetaceae bacterium]